MNDAKCPYCNAGIKINHDDGYGYEEDQIYEQECRSCEKTFVYTTSISYDYETEQAPCLNGGEHKIKKAWGAPVELFEGITECEICGEHFVDEMVNSRARLEYAKKIQRKKFEEV